MNESNISSQTVSDTRIVYDPKDGKIIHIHEIMTLPGAVRPSESEIDSKAIEVAKMVSKEMTSEMAVARINKGDLVPGRSYIVDPTTKSLVSKDAKS